MTGRSRRQDERIELRGALWMTVGGVSLGGHGRIGLLRAIAEHGSITQAAKAMGMSYKAAWDAVDTMNNLAGEALVERTSGGRGGGATRLTARGLRLIERYVQLDAIHQRFVRLLSEEAADLQADLDVLRTLNVRTSARNQFAGTVTAVRAGAVDDEVELTLPGGARIVALLTRESTEALGLRPRQPAFALVAASAVIVATDLRGARLSARNQLPGTVAAVLPDAVNAEVVIDIDGGGSVAATLTQASVRELGLAPGVRASAIFKASSVILGVAL